MLSRHAFEICFQETKRLLQKALHAQGLRSRSICKL